MIARMSKAPPRGVRSIFSAVGPGLLVAATGVGAGDLATAGFAGSKLGVTILWAVVLGAAFKFVLNEGLTRWQLTTGETILEGAIRRLGPLVAGAFIIYFLPWTFFTARSLVTAAGAATQAIVPLDDAETGAVIYGAALSVIGAITVWTGGYKVFARIMTVAIGVMFIAVVGTAIWMGQDWGATAAGLVAPRIPQLHDGGLDWTVSLMGGIGGTVTILCYGYWIREQGREGRDALRMCRIDLGVGYTFTALFGIAMVIIASGVTITGSGVTLIEDLGARLGETSGPAVRWIFLIGAWAAIWSSLLGVWQAVPYLFADYLRIVFRRAEVSTRSWSYRGYLLAITAGSIAAFLLPGESFRSVQKVYAMVGAGFIPMLAVVQLALNTRRAWMADRRNHVMTNVVLVVILLFFIGAGGLRFWPGGG